MDEGVFQGFLTTMDSPSLHDVQSYHGIAERDNDQGNSFSSLDDDSSFSIASSSSDLLMEDPASSYASSSSSSPSSTELDLNGPLFELSELMAHLPIKRGLSKHFEGKSQSFTSLANVRCLEDLAERDLPCRKRMMQCKSYKCGLFSNKSYTPKVCSRTISKKSSRVSFSSFVDKRSSIVGGRPPIHEQKKF